MSATERGRRRGGALEAAILDATWAELLEHGYAGLTMESVAKRAGTSCPVLARRWANRAELAVAAIRNYNKHNSVDVPDLGSVRAELIALLQKLSNRGATTMTKTLLTVSDFKEIAATVRDLLMKDTCDGALERVLNRGVQRGELDRDRITPRILALPLNLLRYEVITTRKAASKKSIEEVVDTVFLPLVEKRQSA
ncbi:TetR/AcrR family transcriptional regulator [Sphingomonas sp. MMS24-J13]|uniref:TetR/AcrR family transcriptional regulator n=1 Tax=Sphingomonas sp. MMS24-J13 TaxID=3238686 RepID=UPI00384B214D